MKLAAQFTIAAALLGFAQAAAAAPAADKPAFVFTAIPDQDETRLAERFGKVAAYLEGKLGVPVRYVPVKSYPAAVTSFVNGDVQLAWFGGITGVQARAKVPGSQAIAQGAEDTAFKSYMIANAATGLKSAPDIQKAIAGHTFTFGARTSTSGRVMPEYYLRRTFDDKAPEQVFPRVGFSGDHSRTIQLVQSGAYDVGVVDYSVWDLDRKAGVVDESKVSVIWQSPPFPDYQWTIRGDADATFGAGFTQKVKDTLVGIADPAILAPFGRSKFVPADNAEYAPVEVVAKAAGLLN
ncbi:putative selenate ABC transporter substrate-binding protein [Lichenibacterium minor]|uniref:Putative selenate ABC transporter substrate-binding protein n=1 Tax=Lichenibacterium minor TaxID=2316528 RepID=A0A4Q2U6V7_9HYPH|nr:putative selenate ABC transporter substrate-binding protein [Lichenibacterium minor]RYC30821.1 putative selenate ABC transporter substrate-binding protein [Lichenibacterium minor]